MMSCAGCMNCHHQSQSCTGGHPLYHYSNPMNPSAVSGMPMLSPQSTPSPGFDSAVDQYLRSVLRPEAFLSSHQPQETINTSFWASHIDPNLPPMNPSVSQRNSPPNAKAKQHANVLPDLPTPYFLSVDHQRRRPGLQHPRDPAHHGHPATPLS